MRHNLFTHPTELSIVFDEDGNANVEYLQEAQTILDVLDDIDYDTKDIERSLRQRIEDSTLIDDEERKELLGQLYVILSENGYLRTVLNGEK